MNAKIRNIVTLFLSAVAMGVAVSPSMAGVICSVHGGTMTVRAISSLAGKRLFLLWDDTDKGDSVSGWAHSASLADAVPFKGGTFTVDLASHGIVNGQICRIAAATVYERLDSLHMASEQAYVDTGIPGKDVYGLRFGFYPTGMSDSGSSDLYSAVNCGKDNGTGKVANRGGFSVCVAYGKDLHRFRFIWRGVSFDKGDNRVETGKINEYAFTNGVCTLNGELQQSGLASGSISTNDHKVFLGRCCYTTYSLHGWWSHVSFDDEEGNRILDYVPVQRVADGKVGFYDRVASTFVASSGAGDFTAGALQGEKIVGDAEIVTGCIVPNRSIDLSMDKAVLTVHVPAGLGGERLTLAWDAEDRGTDISDWSHTAVLSEQIPSIGGTYAVRVSRLGIGNGDAIRVFAANVYRSLDSLHMASEQAYVDTGIPGKDVYGLRFGFYPTGMSNSGNRDLYSAVNCGKDNDTSYEANRGGFSVCVAYGKDLHRFRFIWRGVSFDKGDNRVETGKINEYAFTNGVCTLNGVLQQSDLASGSISTNDHKVFLGRCCYTTYSLHGWWSHVSFDDGEGNRILDYVPVQRVADGKVGFYDRVASTFVASSGAGDFTAGAVADETPTAAVNSCSAALTVKTIAGLVISLR